MMNSRMVNDPIILSREEVDTLPTAPGPLHSKRWKRRQLYGWTSYGPYVWLLCELIERTEPNRVEIDCRIILVREDVEEIATALFGWLDRSAA